VCPACDSDDLRLIGRIPDVDSFCGRILTTPLPGSELYKCCGCSLHFRHPTLPKEMLDALYSLGSTANWQHSARNRSDWETATSWIRSRYDNGSVLDVGCFDGQFLAGLGAGFQLAGIEIHPQAAKLAASRGIRVIGSDWYALAAVSERFDAVVSTDVIEHVKNPLLFLQLLAGVVKPEGVVIIGTGNTESLAWRFFGHGYGYCAIPEHLSFINPTWCRWAAGRLGLQVIASQPFSHGEVSTTRKLGAFAKCAVYKMSPAFFTRLRKWGAGSVSLEGREPSRIHPPSWEGARDHFLTAFSKTLVQRIARNATVAVIQVVVAGLILFILFRFLLASLGAELVGAWALVLASTSIMQLGNLGMSNGVVKFVSAHISAGESEAAAEVIETAVASIAVIFGLLAILAYPALRTLFVLTLDGATAGAVNSVLHWALLSLWLGGISSVFLGSLDGCQRFDLRSATVVGAALVHLFTVMYAVNEYGFVGLAIAQILQSGLTLLLAAFLTKRLIPSLRWAPIHWRASRFRTMFFYGANVQLGTIAIMLFEPLSKWLMTIYGGLANTAYYEMASRMIAQLRNVLIAAAQVMVPVVAAADRKRTAPLYIKSVRLIGYVALPYYAAIAAVIPLISEVWIGQRQEFFVKTSLILLAAHFTSTLSAPAYFFSLGLGRLRWTVMSYFTIAILNVIAGSALGAMMGGIGVAVGAALALCAGSVLLIFLYHVEERITVKDLLLRDYLPLILVCVCLVGIGYASYSYLRESYGLIFISGFLSALFLGLVVPILWRHPIRKPLAELIGRQGK
jgi:O-antigen/teichoic acid export membrane protein/SAM-dependent methyltransferase